MVDKERFFNREIANLKRQLLEQQEQRQTPPNKRPNNSVIIYTTTKMMSWKDCPRGEREVIFASVAKFVWKIIVFAPPEGHKLLAWLMTKTYDNMDPVPAEEIITKQEWIATRVNVVNSIFNNIRCYVSGSLKRVICKYATVNCGNKWPSLQKFKACAYRKIKLHECDEDASEEEKRDTKENLEVFKFYWDEVLKATCPQKTKFWSEKVRYKQTITNERDYAKSPITTQMEAFALLSFENSWDYWKNWQQLQDKFPTRKLSRCPSAEVPKNENSQEYKDGHFVCPVTGKVLFFGPKFVTKYSISNAGSKITGGWSKEGKARFKELVTKIREARMKRESVEVEKIVLAALIKEKNVADRKFNSTEKLRNGLEDDTPRENENQQDDLMAVLDPEMAAEFGQMINPNLDRDELEPPASGNVNIGALSEDEVSAYYV